MFESKLNIKPCRCGNDVFVKLNCWGKYIIGCSNMFCCDWLYNSEGYENKKLLLKRGRKKEGVINGGHNHSRHNLCRISLFIRE